MRQCRTYPLFAALALSLLTLVAFTRASSAEEPLPLANDGYDVVAYFELDRATEGSPDFTHAWKGLTWQFVDARHRDLFIADPEKYAPAYNGYCAWAVSRGYLASTVPQAWSIVDGRLFLNYSRAVQLRWTISKRSNIASGDRRWPDLEPGTNGQFGF